MTLSSIRSVRIAVVDHGTGNLTSIERALDTIGAQPVRTASPREIETCAGVILPGVGAFPSAMAAMRRLDLVGALKERATARGPLLGICLGMQLLFEGSDEMGGSEGLGILDGTVRMLRAGVQRLPHIGWSDVSWSEDSSLTRGLPNPVAMYHVHSFVCDPAAEDIVLGTAEHGERFVTAVESGVVAGVQFHPEKSSRDGLALIANFVATCSEAGE